MKAKIKASYKLNQYEKLYKEKFEDNEIKILRDIKVSREELDEIGKCIKILYVYQEGNALKTHYPLTTSLFLVWSAVYDYKDGDLWSVIFNNLKIKNSSTYQQHLGDIFLYTISKYKLLSIKSNDSKKYFSPILMHGYISNHYAYSFFDYLNKVYSVLLKYDASESNIDRIWNDVFEKEINDISLGREVKQITNNVKQLEGELSYYNIPDDLLKLSRENVQEKENSLNDLNNIISKDKLKIQDLTRQANDYTQVLKYYTEIKCSITYIDNVNSNIVSSLDLEKTLDLVDYTNQELTKQINNIVEEIKKTEKEIKSTQNRLTIEEDKVKSYKMEIATIGKGNIEDGWDDIENCIEINQQLDLLNKELEEKKGLVELSQGVKNTSLRQVLTSSLNHLYKKAPELFKEFIVDSFQAIDADSKNEEIDNEYPLYDNLISWKETYKTKTIRPSYTGGNYYDGPNNEKTGQVPNDNLTKDKDTDFEENKTRLQLDSFSQPYIAYNIATDDINIKIPEQSFYYKDSMKKRPTYYYAYKNESDNKIDIQTYVGMSKINIKEITMPIEKYSEITFKFDYINIREEYVIDLAPIMIFDNQGKLLTSNRLANGFYYVVCSNEWNSDYDGIIVSYPASLEYFKVYEIQLNEDKASFTSKDGLVVDYIGSNMASVLLDGLNIVEGITLDDINISTGKLPQLLINLFDLDSTKNTISVYLDKVLILKNKLDEIIDADFVTKEELLIKMDLKALFGSKRKPHISKIEIIIENKHKHIVFRESFWNLYSVNFMYKNQELLVKNSYPQRIRYKDKAKNTKNATIPLNNEEGEEFSIYYKKSGWKTFKVEVPKVAYEILDKDENKVEIPDVLLTSQLDILKTLYIRWTSNSTIPKTIYLYDDKKILESRLHFKNQIVLTSLHTYYDILNTSSESNRLSFQWKGGNRNSDNKCIINIYKEWKVNNIESYVTEDEDEYVVELTYEYSFNISLKKLLRVYNDANMIFEKELEDEQMIMYIKKDELESLNINIQIVYFEETNNLFGSSIKESLAGEHSFKLPSKIHDLNIIKEQGLIARSFRYEDKDYQFKRPFIINNIKKAVPINFVKEELYRGEAVIEDKTINVLFYLNLDEKIIPFLLDTDIDGAQYQPKTGEVFWENRKDKEIMGPIDDISYIVREE